MKMAQNACWKPLSFRTGCAAIGAGRNLRNGMTAQRAAAFGAQPV